MRMLNVNDTLADLKSSIHERRLVDAELDEICRDFESLKTDYNRTAQLEGDEAVRQASIILESLEALEQEIRAMLTKD